ncbi:hypothetical protein TRAPUB_7704 [Trametes pubescens]|uniref:Uncharacterized protein n=1 Tax=Trametes pubescens TaxID=154538 RepID=A0A1M2V2M0_TRAPU|nr:hypothetical protein TRAPUB_7704 [Trametes pubescens]
MYASSLRTTSKVAPSARYAFSARRVAGKRTFQRFQSTGPSSSVSQGTSFGASHVVAGLAGGGAVLLGGYTWYHFSGVKTAVSASQTATKYYQDTKAAIAEKAPKNPNEALEYLRGVARSYLVLIPGARPHVDAAFDTIDELRESHGDEVNRIVSDGYEEVRKIVQASGSGVDIATATKVYEVLQKRSGELQALGEKAGKDAFGSLSEKYPQVSEKLGGGYDELRKLAQSKGPEAKKLYDETSGQIKEIFSKGFSQESLDQARQLIQSKTAEIQKIAKSSSQDAWQKALKEAGPYLEKLPDVKKLLEENQDKFIAAGAATLTGGSSSVQEIFKRVKEVAEGDSAKNKEKLKELHDFVQKQAEEAEQQGTAQLEKGWEYLQEWLRAMPGGEEALKRVPDVKVFVKVSQDKREEAKKLAQETYEAVLKVLEEKGKKAKQLSEEVKEDTKKKSS